MFHLPPFPPQTTALDIHYSTCCVDILRMIFKPLEGITVLSHLSILVKARATFGITLTTLQPLSMERDLTQGVSNRTFKKPCHNQSFITNIS